MTCIKNVFWAAIICLSIFLCACAKEDTPFFFYGFPDTGPLYVHNRTASSFDEPGSFYGLMDRAVAYLKVGEYQLALEDINMVLVGHGQMRVPAVGLRVLVFMNMGEYDRALEDINVLGINFFSESPNDAWLSHVAGLVHTLRGNIVQAEESLLLAIDFDPRYLGLAVEHLRYFKNRIKNAPPDAYSKETRKWLLKLIR